MAEYELNLRRLLCPMPVIKTQAFVKNLNIGDKITITATDAGSLEDIPAWCRMYNHRVITKEIKEDGDVIITIEIGKEN